MDNPFPGLRPFQQEDDYLFFGREDQTMQLLQRLGDHRFVAVVGSSGSGKSSLVRCGLLSELQGGKMLRAGSAWEIVVTHPGGNPLALLADAFLDAELYDREEEDCREQLLATLSRSHFGLVEAVKQARLSEGTNFLLVVDQFEEIFRFHEAGQMQQEAANEFICLLLEAARQADVPIYIVLTMRSDFIGECGRFEGLAEMVSRGEFLIPRLTREQYKRVIEGPIRVAGGKITPRLLQRLLNDLSQQADQLPCLQHALMRTWSLWAERGESDTLDLEDYQRVGRMSHAMSLHADEVYDSLSDDRQRQLCQGLFQALTVQESESRGIRRPQRLGALCQILDTPAPELTAVIDPYRRRGVTFLMPSPEVELDENTIIDISHESLMRVWTRLRHWVEEEAQAVGVFLRLSESAELHQQGQAGLYRDPELGIALSWRDARQPNEAWAVRYHPGFHRAMEYLEASQQASLAEEQAREEARQRQLEQARKLAEAERQRAEIQRRAAGRLRGLAAGIAVVAVVALIASIAAFYAKRAADLANAAAQHSAQTAKRSAADARRETRRATASEAVAVAAQDALQQEIFSSDMTLTQHAYEAGNVGAMSDLLLEHVPAADEADPRGIEWYLWWSASHQETDIVHQGGGHLFSVAVSPDGTLAADSYWANNIRLREAARPHKVKSWSVANAGASLRWLCFSPDGEMLAAVDGTGRVQRFRTLDTTSLGAVRAPVFLRGLAFSPTQMASGGSNGRIYLWDTSSWARSGFAASSQSLPIWSVSYSPDGQLLAVGTDGGGQNEYAVHGDSPLILWDAAANSVRQTAAGHMARINSVAWSPDGEHLASGSADATVRVWTKDLQPVQTLDTSLSWVSDVAFSPDGRFLAAGTGRDNGIRIWSTATWELVTTIKGHSKPVVDIAFDPRRGGLWSASEDATLKIWDVERSLRQPLDRLADEALVSLLTNAQDAAVSSDGRTLICGREGAPLERYDLQERTVLPPWGGPDMQPVAISDDCTVLVTIDNNGLLRVWRTDDDQQPVAQVQMPPEDISSLHSMAVSRDRSTVAWMAGNPLHLGLFNCRTGEIRQAPLRLSSRSGWRLMRVSKDGRLVFAKNQFSVQLLDVGQFAAGAAPAPTVRRHADLGLATSLAFSSDGKLSAAPSWDSVIHLDDLESGRRLRTLTGHSARVLCAVFSRDRRRLLSGSEDGTVRVWDVETGDSLTTLKGHRGAVTWVGFGRDESEIISVSRADGAVQIWRAIAPNDLEQSVPYWSGLAWRDEHAGRYAEAITALDRAVQLAPDDADLRRRRGALLAKLGQDDAAVHDFIKLVALGAANAEVLHTAKVTAQREALTTLNRATWRYTFQQPPDNWAQPEFDPASWELGEAPFGNRDTDATQWISEDIWLRCEFWSAPISAPLLLDVMCDDDAEFYLNGVLAAEGHYDQGQRQIIACSPEAASTFKPGPNILAVHCHNRQGLAAIDAVLFVSEGLQKWIHGLTAALDDEPGNVHLLLARFQALQEHGGQQVAEARAAAMPALREAVSADLRSADVFWPTSAELLADLLIMESQSHDSKNWRILKPIEMTSAGGATLTRLPDDSILASGTNPDSDLYEIVAETDMARVAALRIEALTHESLPNGGPGRDGTNDLGNFAIDQLRMASSPRTRHNNSSPVSFANAWTDHTNGTLQDVLRGHWNTGGGGGEPHEAIWRLREPISHEDGVRLTFRMQFQQAEQWPGQNLGRFRLWVSGDPAVLERREIRSRLQETAVGWSRLAAAYYLVDNVQALDELLGYKPALAAAIGDLHASAENWEQAVAYYHRLISPDSADPEALAKRGLAYASLGRMDDALADWRRADQLRADVLQELWGRTRLAAQWQPAAALGRLLIEKDPTDRMLWLRTAPTVVLAGNEQGYREFCDRLAKQFADTADPFEADVACKSCLLAPGAIDISQLPLQALAGPLDDGTAPQGLRPWGWACRALAAYRSGDAEQAASYLQKAADNAPAETTTAMIRALRALIRQQRGDGAGARAALQEANSLIDRELPNVDANGLHDWLIPLILTREAEQLLSAERASDAVGPSAEAPLRKQPPLEEL